MHSFYKGDILKYLNNLENESVDLVVSDLSDIKLFDYKDDCLYTKYTYPGLKYDDNQSLIPRSVSNMNKTMVSDIAKQIEKCASWYRECHRVLKNNSIMYVFWPMKYLYLAYGIFDIDRILFWQYSNGVSNVRGDLSYDIMPILIIRKGNPRIGENLSLNERSSVIKITKPQANFVTDRSVTPNQKPIGLIDHLIKLADVDHAGNTIVNCYCKAGSIRKSIKYADLSMQEVISSAYDDYTEYLSEINN